MRKGQFFIIGAVVIITILYSMNNYLNKNVNIDVSDVQGDNSFWVLYTVERNVNYTLDNSNNLVGDLNLLIGKEKDLLIEEGKVLKINYDVFPTEVLVNIILDSKDVHLEREYTYTK
jgi:hypothetical protein